MGRKLLLYLLMTGLTLVVLEIFAFTATQVLGRDDLFDHRDGVLARLNREGLARFADSASDPVLGWRNLGPQVHSEDNCRGHSIEYRYDAAGARIYAGFDPESTEIIVVGDSYTQSAEVVEDEAYPAKLAVRLGVSVANHGVGGYGPTQSVLNLRERLTDYPHAKVVVLGIMYENLYRMMNSYRPVLYDRSSDYSLKPFMHDRNIVPHPGSQAFTSLKQFKKAANMAFDRDFWAKPEPGFPYLATLVESLGSNYFYYRKLQKLFRKLGMPEYSPAFDSDVIEHNLISLLNRYAQIARDRGLQPVAVFIPRNRYDTVSATKFIERHRADIDAGLLLGDLGAQPQVDWVKFNYREEGEGGDNTCHPSPYGYQVIADYIAGFLQANEAWPAP